MPLGGAAAPTDLAPAFTGVQARSVQTAAAATGNDYAAISAEGVMAARSAAALPTPADGTAPAPAGGAAAALSDPDLQARVRQLEGQLQVQQAEVSVASIHAQRGAQTSMHWGDANSAPHTHPSLNVSSGKRGLSGREGTGYIGQIPCNT